MDHHLKETPSQGMQIILQASIMHVVFNGFGIDFDPVTGKLWDAENGEDVYDEINLVEAGFNSGWKLVTCPIAPSGISAESDLVNFEGSHYADPVFQLGRVTWNYGY